MLELMLRFLVVGALAFGGGQAALPLLERLTVAQTGWLSSQEFATGIGLAYATPGPVLILAAFVGFRVSGLLGALAATFAVFTVPVVLAATAARLVARFSASPRFVSFGRYAGAAAIGLLGVTLLSLARPLIPVHPALLGVSGLIFIAALRKVSPVLLLVLAALAGGAIGTFGL